MRYRCKHLVEAMRWANRAKERGAFQRWFAQHGAKLVMDGSNIVLPEEGVVAPGEWVLYSAGEFLVLDNEAFLEGYEAIP